LRFSANFICNAVGRNSACYNVPTAFIGGAFERLSKQKKEKLG
jgi:hypothetical protein